MGVKVVLEWTFKPHDYFEEPFTITRNDYTMRVADGKAEARIDSTIYDADPSTRQRLHASLNDRFLGVQMLTHRAYELPKPVMTRLHPDGRREIFMDLEPGRIVFTGTHADIRVTDKDGHVISDTRRDRIERKKNLAELVAKYRSRDALLSSLLRSHNAAVRDPDNELVHLYEIRDALAVRFGGDSQARTALGIASTAWSRMGELCNNEPLKQGRHRGKASAPLRDATDAELAEIRSIALGMIESYLRNLEASNTP